MTKKKKIEAGSAGAARLAKAVVNKEPVMPAGAVAAVVVAREFTFAEVNDALVERINFLAGICRSWAEHRPGAPPRLRLPPADVFVDGAAYLVPRLCADERAKELMRFVHNGMALSRGTLLQCKDFEVAVFESGIAVELERVPLSSLGLDVTSVNVGAPGRG